MERIEIVEMSAIQNSIEQPDNVMKTYWDIKGIQTILDNDFWDIPGGFTGVYLRETPVQVVPNCLLEEIKLASTYGYFDAPEDHELILLEESSSDEGVTLTKHIIELAINWLHEKLK